MSVQLIAIHGAPRSGTSWLGQLFNSSESVQFRYQPLFSYAFKDFLSPDSDARRIDEFAEALLRCDDDFVLQRNAASLSGYSLDFEKTACTHLVYKEVRHHDILPSILERCPSARGIGIIRDPRAVIQSWMRAPREFAKEWNIREEWRFAPRKNAGHPENWYGLARWIELSRLLMNLESDHPDRFRIVCYEDLVEDPHKTLQELFRFCGLGMTPQVTAFIERSRTQEDGQPYGVLRRGRTSTPSFTFLPADLVTAIEEETRASGLGRFIR